MRRRWVIGLLVVILALGGFYLAWPAWSARQIAAAIEANDAAALERRVDFARVRERARPLAAAEFDRRLEQFQRQSGPLSGAIAGQLKESLGGQLAQAAVDSLLTPENVIQMVRRGSDFRKALRGAAEQRSAGGDRKGAPEARPEGGPRRLGLANIKRFALTGPLSLAMDLARNEAASDADVTIEMAFSGGTWKVVGIVPRL